MTVLLVCRNPNDTAPSQQDKHPVSSSRGLQVTCLEGVCQWFAALERHSVYDRSEGRCPSASGGGANLTWPDFTRYTLVPPITTKAASPPTDARPSAPVTSLKATLLKRPMRALSAPYSALICLLYTSPSPRDS
eukprot:TRINITY_DN23468_c0_g1_i2.p1 TRINITY_DN23468_c0_g1~~TRINITY_DN23468_c0_g1_i2.p1  ORF type:complete len:134 (+),score=4.28 TRINITY_DN23468_c0_g1_i2:409-810(+)